MKKRIIAMALALVSLCALLLGAVEHTLAYVVDASDSVVNVFAPAQTAEETVTAYIPVFKRVQNAPNAQMGPAGFVFALREISSGVEKIAVSDGSGEAGFYCSFAQAQAGQSFVYELYEVNDGREGVVYSTAVYTVEIRVRNENGVLDAEVRIDGGEVERAVFRNIYDPEGVFTPPETGDGMHPAVYMAVLAMCIGGMAAAFRPRRKRG